MSAGGISEPLDLAAIQWLPAPEHLRLEARAVESSILLHHRSLNRLHHEVDMSWHCATVRPQRDVDLIRLRELCDRVSHTL
jgi:hypothetical protein